MEAFVFLADVFTDQVKAATESSGLSTRDILLGLTAVLVVGFALFGWVYFRVRRNAYRADQQRLSQMVRSSAPSESKGEKGERRRKRRRRRDHRPRNASLDKTLGLPPPHADHQLPKY